MGEKKREKEKERVRERVFESIFVYFPKQNQEIFAFHGVLHSFVLY